ncbi:MAG: threonine aldolase [Acidobacteria bacterium]|nr:threonine aldolase [Acidobacteriota bacterium]NIM62414.1 threonine aldolase [Acidobacteriota bacterium]NIO60708.1 threonine aldolase [Acidobacteriota bacterium]NIQ31773.1 threonine aldolase [Acidobacteriota bacterium]NIQ87079.1 threonine aldolase [Acidobacteriota bacterium]
MDRIDFRSDTVGWPTPEMREAMATARVGDDVYGEDPTVNELEALAAEMLGKEAGLFVTSGTQGNLVALLGHARRGDEAILGYESHIFQWEVGGMASIGGILPHTLPTDAMGRMDPAAVDAAVRDTTDHHYGHSRLLLVENTFGGRGGVPLPAEYFSALRRIADKHSLAMHMDGARLFNAAVALGVEARELVADVDTVTFCLSKGLCAPVGSILCGPTEFIEEARRTRKSLGGGMRQAGILAAAGLVAMNSMIDRLADDHAHARLLAQQLAEIDGVNVKPKTVQTNIVFFELEGSKGISRERLCARLDKEYEIGLDTYPPNFLRAVTHYWVGEKEVGALVEAVAEIIRTGGGE